MNVRDKKGSITIFVLVGLLFMTGFLIISFGSNVNKSKVAKEQFNIMSSIYSHNDGDENAYNRAYTVLRKKKAKTLTVSVENASTVELIKTFEGELTNYKIYGSMGTQIIMKVTNEDDSTNQQYTINLSSSLQETEYIDYKTQSVLYEDGTIKESVSLPRISIYEDYTKIQVISGGTPSKIEVEYEGYTFE